MKKGLAKQYSSSTAAARWEGLSDTVGGFSSMLKKQKNTEGTALITVLSTRKATFPTG